VIGRGADSWRILSVKIDRVSDVGFKGKSKQTELDHESARLKLEHDYSKWQSACPSALNTIQQWIFDDVALRDRLRTEPIERRITDDFLKTRKQLDELKIELRTDDKRYVVIKPLPLTPRLEGSFGRMELVPSGSRMDHYYLDWDGKLDSTNGWWFRSPSGFEKRLNADSLDEVLGDLFDDARSSAPGSAMFIPTPPTQEQVAPRDLVEQAAHPVDFTFITNAKLRAIAERDWDECQRAYQSKCWKSVLILAGGLVETILLSTLGRRKKRALKTKAASGAPADLTRWDLGRLINAALELKIVPPAVETLPEPLRKYRNLAHPGNEVREKLKFDEPEASTAFHAVRAILSRVSGSDIAGGGTSADPNTTKDALTLRAVGHEAVGKSKAELAEQVLADFHEARDIINGSRLPFTFEGEGASRPKVESESEGRKRRLDCYYAVAERLRSKEDFFAQVAARRYRFIALFGKDGAKAFDELVRIRNEILVAVGWLVGPYAAEWTATDRTRMEKTIGWGDPKNDPIPRRLDEAVQMIERACRPVIQLSTR
jgi:hypothetical protein